MHSKGNHWQKNNLLNGRASPWLSSKESACNTGDTEDTGLTPGKIWRAAWQSSPVLLPGKSHGQRSLAGYCPCGQKESDTTEATEHWMGENIYAGMTDKGNIKNKEFIPLNIKKQPN